MTEFIISPRGVDCECVVPPSDAFPARFTGIYQVAEDGLSEWVADVNCVSASVAVESLKMLMARLSDAADAFVFQKVPTEPNLIRCNRVSGADEEVWYADFLGQSRADAMALVSRILADLESAHVC